MIGLSYYWGWWDNDRRQFAILDEVLKCRQQCRNLLLCQVHSIVGDVVNSARVLLKHHVFPALMGREPLQANLSAAEPDAVLGRKAAFLQAAFLAVLIGELIDTKTAISCCLFHVRFFVRLGNHLNSLLSN